MVFATRALIRGQDVGGPALLTAGLAGHAAEGIALPVVLDALGRLGRKDFQLRFRFRFGGRGRPGFIADLADLDGGNRGDGGSFGNRGGWNRDR